MSSLASLTPSTAWEPLPRPEWDEAAARHLLRRIGFSATPPATAQALAEGPEATLRRFFREMPEYPQPACIAALEAERDQAPPPASLPPEERRTRARERRERSRDALHDMIIRWLQLAAAPECSPAEKWLLFLSDVWVASAAKVEDTALVFQQQDILRRHALGRAPDLAKAVSRSPAMIVYLDLQQSARGAPNENFARELFELFTLGEGHYTEADIKAAARAFTGYRQKLGAFRFDRRRHDDGAKTVFGRTGRFDGDDVIDLVFRQPAAATFLPGEMVRFYLSETPLPADLVAALGSQWAENGYDLRALLLTFFRSRAFFAAEFRDNFIKSPVQFHLGLLQDLGLGVTPLPRKLIGPLRQMGQLPFVAPNVRGWVGGRDWINSATLATRRRLVRGLLSPPDDRSLNADERAALQAAVAAGAGEFTFPPGRLREWAALPPAQAADRLVATVLPGHSDRETAAGLAQYLAEESKHPETALRTALAALLDSPDYQLC
jgi:uncharacterized protein (DUF1800 family)